MVVFNKEVTFLITEIMKLIDKYFINYKQVEKGNFIIKDGIIDVTSPYIKGQYIRIIGSILNDGVYLVSDDLLTLAGAQDEVFNGMILGLSVPRDFIKLVDDIEKFEKSSDIEKRDLASVRIGEYAETRATGKDGTPISWQSVFRRDLDKYRRMFPEPIEGLRNRRIEGQADEGDIMLLRAW